MFLTEETFSAFNNGAGALAGTADAAGDDDGRTRVVVGAGVVDLVSIVVMFDFLLGSEGSGWV